MSKFILNDELRAQLEQLYYPVEFCDTSGRVVGRFFPQKDLSEYEPLTPEISQDELQRRLQSDEKRYSTAEVIAHLEAL